MTNYEMTYKYIIVNDSNVHDIKHNRMFKTVADANAYMSKHKLHIDYLCYDLSTAACITDIASVTRVFTK